METKILLRDGSERSVFLHNLNPDDIFTGGELFELSDGSLMVQSSTVWRTVDRRTFEPYPVADSGCANWIRLKDGRIMAVYGESTENICRNWLKAMNLYAIFSDDEGKTFYGKSVISANNECLYLMNHRFRRLKNGRIVLPLCLHPNHLLADTENFEAAGWITLFWTDDEGQTWQHGEWVTSEMVDQLCEPCVEEMPDGSLKMLARTNRGYLYQVDSRDGGQTWTQERPTQLRSALSPFNFEYDPYSKRYIVCWDDSFPSPVKGRPRTPLCMAVSEDGEHWTKVLTLGNGPRDAYGYPAFRFERDAIYLTYYICPGDVWNDRRLHFAEVPRDCDELLMTRE